MSEKAKRRFLTWTLLRRVAIACFILAVVGIGVIVAVVAALSRDLPTVTALAGYEPPITSRVHAGDGTLIAEFANEHRVYVPYESIPEHVVQAFVSAEDKNFFRHDGLDYIGIVRAAFNSARNQVTGEGGLQGGSTITQQVVKNMLLTNDQNIVRKIREAVLARRVERAFSKEEILELYLNEIYLGFRSYGVGSASLNYFNKSLTELTLSEAAILASLAKAPSSVNPYSRPDRLLARRNYVIGRMVEDGYITQAEADEAIAQPLTTTRRLRGEEYEAAIYFVQELRRDLIQTYGEETLEQGGLSIRTTIDTDLQLAAQRALRDGLVTYDRRQGFRGPLASIELNSDAIGELAGFGMPSGHGSWEAALVTSLNADGTASLRLADNSEIRLFAEDVTWAAETFDRDSGGSGLSAGDIILVQVRREPMELSEEELRAYEAEDRRTPARGSAAAVIEALTVPVGQAALRQIPNVEGAIVALDPHTGRVLAMSGGFSFYRSAFNRVTQAQRQVGSAFKPFVYAAALENGYTPASLVLDAPFVDYDVSSDDFWSPGNYAEGRFYGLSTLRLGLEKSRNLMTVRLAQDIGMETVSELAGRMGVYDDLDPFLAMSLGAGETTMMRMAIGYAAFVNGGHDIDPTLLDRVQDRHGNTLYVNDPRDCSQCNAENWDGGEPPRLADPRPQVLDPVVAYQVVHMLEGVVERGTGAHSRRVGRPLAGKTGTTNDYKDALFFGFSPDLVVGIWVGFDEPRPLGANEGGGSVASPIFTQFMTEALEGEPILPFRIPPGVRLVQIDARTGDLPGPGTDEIILEAFRPGTEPGVVFDDDSNYDIFNSGNGDGLFGTPLRSEPRGQAGDVSELDPSAQPASPDELGPAQPAGGGGGGEETGLAAQELGDTW